MVTWYDVIEGLPAVTLPSPEPFIPLLLPDYNYNRPLS